MNWLNCWVVGSLPALRAAIIEVGLSIVSMLGGGKWLRAGWGFYIGEVCGGGAPQFSALHGNG